MKATTIDETLSGILSLVGAPFCALVLVSSVSLAQPLAADSTSRSTTTSTTVRTFDTPQKAAAVLIEAADKFDVPTLMRIFGPEGDDVVFSGEFA